jgi:hypothetical protein
MHLTDFKHSAAAFLTPLTVQRKSIKKIKKIKKIKGILNRAVIYCEL